MVAKALITFGPFVAGKEYDVVETPNETLGKDDIALKVGERTLIAPKSSFDLGEDYTLRDLKGGEQDASQGSGEEGSGSGNGEGGSPQQEQEEGEVGSENP